MQIDDLSELPKKYTYQFKKPSLEIAVAEDGESPIDIQIKKEKPKVIPTRMS